VLTDAGTRSAGEFMASWLWASGATVMGERTVGGGGGFEFNGEPGVDQWGSMVSGTNGAYLSEKLQFPSFLRKQESSDFRLSDALDPRFRGDDELK
jgi:hypothetical protein